MSCSDMETMATSEKDSFKVNHKYVDGNNVSENQVLENSSNSKVFDAETDMGNVYGDENQIENQHYRFDEDEDLDYYYEDEEIYNYGDGLDEYSFEGVKSFIFYLVTATTRLHGRVKEDAEQYLLELLAVCSSDQRKELMKVQNGKHTPLSLACEIGNLSVVRFFVEECGADVDEFSGWPLYWAVHKDQKAIAQYLLDHNADVSHCYRTDYNLLMVALDTFASSDKYDSIFEAVLMENNMKTPKMDIVNILVDHGAIEKCSNRILFKILTKLFTEDKEPRLKIFLDRIPELDDIKNNEGMSVLEYAISQSNLYGIRMLTEHGANINGCRSDMFRCKSIPGDEGCDDIGTNINHVLESYLNKSSKESIGIDQFIHPVVYAAHIGNARLLNHLLAYSEIPIEAKLDALELAGAYLMVKYQKTSEALKCWNSAIDIRMGKDVFITVGESSHTSEDLLNVPFIVNLTSYHAKKDRKQHLKKVQEPRRAFDFCVEFQSKEELKLLDVLEIRIQASLLYERLIGYGNNSTLSVLVMLARKFINSNKIDAFVALTTYNLPYFLKFGKKVAESVVRSLVISMCRAVTLKYLYLGINFDIMFAFLKCIFLVCFKLNGGKYQSYHMNCLLYVINKLLQAEKNEEQNNSLQQFLRIVIKSDLRDVYKQTLLHHCVLIPKRDALINEIQEEDEHDEKYFTMTTNWLKRGFDDPVMVINLLLELGANPNTFDIHGKTPLHTFFLFPNPYPPERQTILKALLEAGAHTDYQDQAKQTPITISCGTSLPLCPVADRTLQCLAAGTILKNQIPYSNQLTLHLVQFVSDHKDHGSSYNMVPKEKHLYLL